MKKKQLVFIAWLCLVPLSAHQALAQNSPVIPSAESMGLVRSVQHPVNHTSGVVGIGVPLYNIEYNGLRVPVALSYHASGIKVEDRPGLTGLGWYLQAGGKITRVVKQYPDRFLAPGGHTAIWGYTPQQVGDTLFNNIPSDYVNYHGSMDSEPDLFYFEIPGRSGMFVFDAESVARTIPYQNLTIEMKETNLWTWLSIRDEQGTIYEFGTTAHSKEETTVWYENPNLKNGKEALTYTSTWHLTSIVSHTGERIDFEYTEAEPQRVEQINYVNYYSLYHSTGYVETQKEEEVKTTIATDPAFLSAIVWGDERLEFGKHPDYPECLGSIAYRPAPGADPVKTTRFTYEPGSHTVGRTRLTQVRDHFADNSSALVATFRYTPNHLPPYGSMDYDHWGYYNGKSNTSHIPSFDGMTAGTPVYTGFVGADRSPDLESTMADVLTAIVYPTGGRTEYEYELNRYREGSAEENAGGLRIREIRYRDGDRTLSTRYEYLTEDGLSSGRRKEALIWGYIANGGVVNLQFLQFAIHSKPINGLSGVDGQYVSYSCVTETHPDNSTARYHYTSSETYGDIYSDSLPTIWKRDDDVMSVYYGGRGPGVSIGDQYDIQSTSRFWRRNLIESVERFDPFGELVEQTNYTYDLQQANRWVVKSYTPYIRPFRYTKEEILCEYQWESQPVYLQRVETVATGVSLPSVTEYTYNAEYMVPTATRSTDVESNVVETTIRYPFDYADSGSGEAARALSLLRDGRIVVPVETVVRRNGKVVGADLRTFVSAYSTARGAPLLRGQYTLPVAAPLGNFMASGISSGGSFTFDSRYELQSINTDFDERGRVVASETPTGQRRVVVYRGNFIVAEVENAGLDEVRAIVGSPPGSGSISDFQSSALREIPGALVTTYTYRPGYGVATATDPAGRTVTYEYDAAGRLLRVLDPNGHVVEQYEYHFRPTN